MKSKLIPLSVLLIGMLLLAGSFFITGSEAGDLDVTIEKADFIMPAAHRVYSNPDALDGKYFLFKAKITNKGQSTLEDVTVKYRVPDYIDWTELTVSGEMFPGQTLVVPCYPKFKEDITEKTTESLEKAEIEISWDNAEEDDFIEEEFAFKLTNRNEYVYTGIKKEEISTWSDMFDNDELIACFVTPNDPIVKYYTQNLQEKLLKGEAASVTNKPENGVRFLAGIYEATRKSHMVYSGTKGIPQSTEDVQSIVQQVRLPREVITGNTGLCIELSTLYASILSAAGLNPVIYMIPGHAYPGFRMNGQYFAIEATAINGEGLGGILSAEEAFKKGQKELEEFMQRAQAGDPRYTLIDIHAVNQEGVTAMNLPDNEFLRKKVDDVVAAWSGKSTKTAKRSSRVASNTGKRSSNPYSVSIPRGWQTLTNPVPNMPILTASSMSPDQTVSLSIYDVPAQNTNQAVQLIQQYLQGYGMYVEYQLNGNQIAGQTSSDNGLFNWVGKSMRTQNGIRIVTVGSFDYLYSQNSGLINQIFNSIR